MFLFHLCWLLATIWYVIGNPNGCNLWFVCIWILSAGQANVDLFANNNFCLSVLRPMPPQLPVIGKTCPACHAAVKADPKRCVRFTTRKCYFTTGLQHRGCKQNLRVHFRRSFIVRTVRVFCVTPCVKVTNLWREHLTGFFTVELAIICRCVHRHARLWLEGSWVAITSQ